MKPSASGTVGKAVIELQSIGTNGKVIYKYCYFPKARTWYTESNIFRNADCIWCTANTMMQRKTCREMKLLLNSKVFSMIILKDFVFLHTCLLKSRWHVKAHKEDRVNPKWPSLSSRTTVRILKHPLQSCKGQRGEIDWCLFWSSKVSRWGSRCQGIRVSITPLSRVSLLGILQGREPLQNSN